MSRPLIVFRRTGPMTWRREEPSPPDPVRDPWASERLRFRGKSGRLYPNEIAAIADIELPSLPPEKRVWRFYRVKPLFDGTRDLCLGPGASAHLQLMRADAQAVVKVLLAALNDWEGDTLTWEADEWAAGEEAK